MQRSTPSPRQADEPKGDLAAAAAVAAAPGAGRGMPDSVRRRTPRVPPVFLEYDQIELDASYEQRSYEPLHDQVSQRLASNSEAVRARIGAPRRVAYGPTEIEKLDIYRAGRANAPIFVLHSWRDLAVGLGRRTTAFPPRCSSMPGRIMSPSISSRSPP